MLSDFRKYATDSGRYRRYLMRQESMSTAELFDCIDKLRVRVKRLESCPEIQTGKLTRTRNLHEDIKKMRRYLEEHGSTIISASTTQKSHRQLAKDYDLMASVVEGMENATVEALHGEDARSEDAQFIKRRTHTQKSKPADKRKSQAAKQAWKTNKGKYKKAIKRFHKSTKGRQFHRSLTRYNRRNLNKQEDFKFFEDDALTLCKGLSSAQTSLLIEQANIMVENAAEQTHELLEMAKIFREIFYIFNDMLLATHAALMERDYENINDVLIILNELYEMDG